MRTWKHRGVNEGGFTIESNDRYLLSVHHDGSEYNVTVGWYDELDYEFVTVGTTLLSELGDTDVEDWADEMIDGPWPESTAWR